MDIRGIALQNVHSYLAESTELVKQLNYSGKFGINKNKENFAINLLNGTYGYNLKNANDILSANFPAIDLVDENKSVVIQVTSTADNKKNLYTIEKFISKELYTKYKELYIYLLIDKPNYYKVLSIN